MWKIKTTAKNITCTIDLFSLFHAIRRYNGIFLFSAQVPGGKNIAGFNPLLKIKEETIEYHHKSEKIEQPLKLMDTIVSAQEPADFGFMGYVAYDYKDRLEEPGLYQRKSKGIFPDFYFTLFEHYFMFQSGSRRIRVFTLEPKFGYISVDINTIISSVQARQTVFTDTGKRSFYDGTSLPKKEYEDAVRKTISSIKAGELYQANITREIYGHTEFTPEEIGLQLYRSNRIEFGVFARIEGNVVISTSPERFFRVRRNRILASPIKGTIGKMNQPQYDAVNRKTLASSEKDIAELAMIVDLLRNDLSKVCDGHRVRVKRFPRILELANVFHLAADIEGKLALGVGFDSIMRSLFPGGSISGCPKIQACFLIGGLEKGPRGLYTGNFGYYAFSRNMDFNIMIRSLFLNGPAFSFHVGGGITLLSDPEKEYIETIYKAKNIWEAIHLEDVWEERYCIMGK